ncbi:O-antigen polymerase [Cytobacillus kochii]|uniref:O-antigen polymerase n=1 Tax=Cytobacillus kochii TaxID=859143 RepID=UPI00402A91C5
MKKEALGRASIIILVFLLLSLLLAFFSYGEEKVLLIFLPLIYGVVFISIAQIHRYINHPGMFVLNLISAIRYLLIPILIIIYPDYKDEYGSLTQGIIFMIFEAICLGLFIIYITKKYYRGRKFPNHIKVKNNNNILLKLIIIYAVLIVILNPTILLQYNFVFVDSENVELIKRSAVITGLSGLIVDWGKLLLPLLICIPLIKKYRVNNNNLYYYLVIVVILVINLMFFSGTSRNSVIMPATASMFFLIKAFPNKKRKIAVLMSFAIVIVALQLTVLKTEYIGTRTEASLESSIDYLESYFGGPENMGITVIAKETYSNTFNIDTFLNDVLGNFPGLSQYFNMENRTTTFYNLIFYNGGLGRDQIIPSMGQGLFYFGYLFSFIPQMLIVWGMAKFDSMYRNTSDILGVYFLSYFAVRFGFTFIQNISIILNFIYSMILPIMFILFLNEMINRRFTLRGSLGYAKNKAVICDKQY